MNDAGAGGQAVDPSFGGAPVDVVANSGGGSRDDRGEGGVAASAPELPSLQAGAGAAAAGAPDGAPADDEPPRVVRTLPAAAATGVVSGDLLIEFSEPMQPASVEVVLAGANQIDATWNPAGDALTLHTELTLESATEPPVGLERASCRVSILADARDLAGNALGADFTLEFSPAVRVSQRFNIVVGLRGHAEGTYMLAGDTSTNVGQMALVPFDLAAIPENVLGVESAQLTLAVRRRGQSGLLAGNPFGDLGDLRLEHAHFTERSYAAYSAAGKLADLGVLFTAASPLVVDEPFDIDVTSSVGDDLMHRFERNSLSEYRLRFDESTDNDDSSDQVMFWNYPAVHTSCDGACLPYQIPHLTVTYLVP